MSNNIIKRTAIATAVSSAFVATLASAATLPNATMTNKQVEQVKEIAADKKAPSAHMIVLKQKLQLMQWQMGLTKYHLTVK